MTTNSNKIVIPEHIKIKVPEKPYYGKYTHKLDLVATKEQTAATMRSLNNWRFNRTNYYNVQVEITKPIKRIIADHELETGQVLDYRLRQEGATVNLYFSDTKVLELVLADRITSKIVSLHQPINDKHLEVMEVNKKIRVRKSLFNKSYRYKLYIKNTIKFRKEELSSFNNWIKETFPEDSRISVNTGLDYLLVYGKIKERTPTWYTYNTVLAIYINDEVDLMLMKLRLNEHIAYIEEAVLFTEL
jgi:hypothetical protein